MSSVFSIQVDNKHKRKIAMGKNQNIEDIFAFLEEYAQKRGFNMTILDTTKLGNTAFMNAKGELMYLVFIGDN